MRLSSFRKESMSVLEVWSELREVVKWLDTLSAIDVL